MIAIGLDPTIVQLGPLALTWHGLFTALGIVAGAWLGLHLARRTGFPEELLLAILPWAILGGIVGARLLHVVDNWPLYAGEP